MATKMQVLMAYKCVLALKDLIQTYLLRRTKQEVLETGASGELDVDQKRQGYEDEEGIVGSMTELLTETDEDKDGGESVASFGAASDSGKMIVLQKLLTL
ncbi:hypothetical protein PsorP6_006740 [Peronosclerospora sorghi]|uniref:Uncharacterized protein n=1 Tax=Peronosclerospora sorghi TaxID=230839 RepID=A0ACC0W1B0_9STRA|nr:hypothetical protein PsorP6_006740 [Peronosclerospora sorghi]